jgi:(5-formylfuran-3-yl)methyl phosphate synthase
VAKLLVSVRSRVEALAALAGGATIIDVKEPKNGPLGRASFDVWREVRKTIPEPVRVSVALGELNDWSSAEAALVPSGAWSRVAFRKLGLSHAPPDWVDRWESLRRQWGKSRSPRPAWVAVVYIDWQLAGAPHPESIIQAAGAITECQGVLFDTWDKSRCPGIDLTWKRHIDRVRDSGRFVALAGSLDVDAIGRLAPLAPDIFAVRGSACAGGNRLGPIDPERVSILARAAEAREAVTWPPDGNNQEEHPSQPGALILRRSFPWD